MRIVCQILTALLGVALVCDAASAASAGDPARRVKVACIGDSIPYGWKLANRERDAFPAQLQRMLGDGYEVRNFSVPGLGVYLHLPWPATKNGKRAWSLSPECAASLAWQPDIVISNLGANDLAEYPNEFIPGTNGVPALARGTFRKQYTDVLNAFKADGRAPRILMWTRLCAMKGNSAAKYGMSMFVMAEDLHAVAEAVGAEGIDMYPATAESARREEWLDETHPPASGHRVIAEEVYKALKRDDSERLARAASGAEQLSVLSWNTQHYGWEQLKPEKQSMLESNMFEVVRAVNPDIFLMQETYGSFERFKAALPEYDARLLGRCNSIFSRFPITGTHEPYREKNNYGEPEGGAFNTQVADLDAGGMRLRACPVAASAATGGATSPLPLSAPRTDGTPVPPVGSGNVPVDRIGAANGRDARSPSREGQRPRCPYRRRERTGRPFPQSGVATSPLPFSGGPCVSRPRFF